MLYRCVITGIYWRAANLQPFTREEMVLEGMEIGTRYELVALDRLPERSKKTSKPTFCRANTIDIIRQQQQRQQQAAATAVASEAEAAAAAEIAELDSRIATSKMISWLSC